MTARKALSSDQLFKDLFKSLFRELIELFFPETAKELLLDQPEFIDKEVFTDMPQGARRTLDILALVLRKGVLLAGAGIVVGVILSAGAASSMGSVLYGVSPHDTQVFLVVPLVLLGVALGASFIPGWRAARVEPVVALREV